jgi:hypothetical protein
VSLALPTSEGLNLEQLVAIGALSAPPLGTSITLPEDATGKAGLALGDWIDALPPETAVSP